MRVGSKDPSASRINSCGAFDKDNCKQSPIWGTYSPAYESESGDAPPRLAHLGLKDFRVQPCAERSTRLLTS